MSVFPFVGDLNVLFQGDQNRAHMFVLCMIFFPNALAVLHCHLSSELFSTTCNYALFTSTLRGVTMPKVFFGVWKIAKGCHVKDTSCLMCWWGSPPVFLLNCRLICVPISASGRWQHHTKVPLALQRQNASCGDWHSIGWFHTLGNACCAKQGPNFCGLEIEGKCS